METRNATFSYGGAAVISDVTISIAEREYVCIVGPNGGGKTTLLKLIVGLLEPDSGEIRVMGLPPRRARQMIGYMPQHSMVDFQFPISVADVVATGLLPGGAGPAGYRSRGGEAVRKSLEEVGIAEFMNRPFSNLSGGQRQRALIARAIVSNPQLLLLDEPASNMDIAAERGFYELLKTLNSRMTIVMVSHNPWVVSNSVKNVVCMQGSCSIHHQTPEEAAETDHVFGGGFKMVRHDHNKHAGRGDD